MVLIAPHGVVDITYMGASERESSMHHLSCSRCGRQAVRLIRDGAGLCARHLVAFADPHRVPTAMAMRSNSESVSSTGA